MSQFTLSIMQWDKNKKRQTKEQELALQKAYQFYVSPNFKLENMKSLSYFNDNTNLRIELEKLMKHIDDVQQLCLTETFKVELAQICCTCSAPNPDIIYWRYHWHVTSFYCYTDISCYIRGIEWESFEADMETLYEGSVSFKIERGSNIKSCWEGARARAYVCDKKKRDSDSKYT